LFPFTALANPVIDWSHWHNEPFLVGGLIVLGWAYAVVTGPLRTRLTDASFPRPHAVRFYFALILFYLGVGSPLDQIAERYLLSAHMLQHQIIIYPAALLFLSGLPDWLARPIMGHARLRPILRVLTNPVVCGAIYVAVISGWHLPFLYDLALQNRPVHIAEHFMMFGAALLFWWPLCSPVPELPRASYAGRMIYLVAVIIGMTPVFAYITFSPDVLYPTYEFAPRITNLTAAADQLLAGVMMKLGGMAVALIAFGASFYRWYQHSERAGSNRTPSRLA
jgi:putative membrane protein